MSAILKIQAHFILPGNFSDSKAIVVPLIKNERAVCLRNELRVDERKGVRGWKNVKMIQTDKNAGQKCNLYIPCPVRLSVSFIFTARP